MGLLFVGGDTMTVNVFTLYSYEDNEIKDVVASIDEAHEWIAENRDGNEEDILVEKWTV